MAGNEFGRLVGFSRLYVRDGSAVLAHDRGTPREREFEGLLRRSTSRFHQARRHGGYSAAGHHGVERGSSPPRRMCRRSCSLQSGLVEDRARFLAVGHIPQTIASGPARSERRSRRYPGQIRTTGRTRAPRSIGRRKPSPRTAGGPRARGWSRCRDAGEIGDQKPFVGGGPSLDDVFPDQLRKRGALAGRPNCISVTSGLALLLFCTSAKAGSQVPDTRGDRYDSCLQNNVRSMR